MSIALDDFRASYASALNLYLRNGPGSALHAAQELGRRAVEEHVTMCELAAAYHEPLLLAIRTAPNDVAAAQVARSASHFYLESLTAVEEVLGDMREIAQAERCEMAARTA